MRVDFLRHGLADREAWDGPDFERPLTPRGARRMEATGEALLRLGLAPDAILTSPLVRARQTAEIVAERLGLVGRLAVDERLGPDFDVDALARLLADHPAAQYLMLVGHEPGFSLTLGAVTGGDVVCKKGGLARVDLAALDPPAGSLVWLLPPRVLAPDD